MNSDFNEDEILTILNDIELSGDELSSENLTEIEKKNLKKNILSSIKPRKLKIKKRIIAASVAVLIVITLPLFKTNNLNVIYSKITSINKGKPNATTVIPNLGQITLANNTGLILNKSLKAQGITLNSIYIDKSKAIASITSDSFIHNYQSAKYTLKDSEGNIYNLKQTKLATGYGTSMTYRIEFNGSIKPSSNYTLNLLDNKVNFELTASNFNEIHASKPLYTATSGNTTFNITSISKNNNILRVDYYFTYKNTDGTKPSLSLLNPSCFKDDFTEDSYKDVSYINKQIKENPNNSYLTIHDEYGNMDYGHNYTKTFGNESFFDLKKLKGNNLKLELPALEYNLFNSHNRNNFNVSLNVPKNGKQEINKTYKYKGYKFRIVSIERVSDKSVRLICKAINNSNNPKIRDLAIAPLNSTLCNSFIINSETPNKLNLNNIVPAGCELVSLRSQDSPIGDTLTLNTINLSYLYVGSFKIDINLNHIKN